LSSFVFYSAVFIFCFSDDRGVPWADVVGFSYGGAVAQHSPLITRRGCGGWWLAATNCGIGAFPGWLPPS
jgi:hypothetical protein